MSPPTHRPLKAVPTELSKELGDYAETQGKILASVVRLERGWEAMRHEHETYTRMVVKNQLELEDMQHATKAAVGRTQKLVPLVITLLELIRQVALHYGILR